MKTKCFFMLVLLVAFLFGPTSSLFPSESSCMDWNARGFWTLNGQTPTVQMHLDQKIRTITGRASCNGGGGDVVGTVGGASLNFQIKWSNGAVSTFTGTITPDGRIQGTWFPGAYDGTVRTWSGDRAMTCADSAPATATAPQNNPPPPAKVVQSQAPSGRISPVLSAYPAIVTVPPGHSRGTVRISWDGGRDHPNAQLWWRVSGREKKSLNSKSWGETPVSIVPGETYLFILADSSEELATTTVTIAGAQGRPIPAATASAEAEESSSSDTEDHHKKKNKKNKNKHHHHHDDDDDENQGND